MERTVGRKQLVVVLLCDVDLGRTTSSDRNLTHVPQTGTPPPFRAERCPYRVSRYSMLLQFGTEGSLYRP